MLAGGEVTPGWPGGERESRLSSGEFVSWHTGNTRPTSQCQYTLTNTPSDQPTDGQTDLRRQIVFLVRILKVNFAHFVCSE